jgi:hypothetical protein
MRRAFLFLIGAIALAFASGGLSGPSGALAAPNSLGIDHDFGSPDINAGPAVVAPGGIVTVALTTEAPAEGLGAWDVTVQYDPFVLEPVDCEAHAGGLCAVLPAVRVVGADFPGLSGVTNLAHITFKALAPIGKCSALTPLVGIWTDPLSIPLQPLVSGGTVCVVAADSQLGIDHNGAPPDINGGPLNVPRLSSTTVGVVAETPAAGIGAWTIDIHYDPAVLEPVSCVANPAGLCNVAFSVIEVRVVGATLAGLFGTVNLADITFRAVGPAGACSDLVPEVREWFDPTAQWHPVGTSNGKICVSEPCADVTGDGRVTLRDLGAIALRIALRRYDPRFDLNGDGVVNRADFLIALRQLGTTC